MEHNSQPQGPLSKRFENIQNSRKTSSSLSRPVFKEKNTTRFRKMTSFPKKRSFPRPEFKIYNTRYEMSDFDLKNVLDDELKEYMDMSTFIWFKNFLPKVDASNEGRKIRLLDIEIENYFEKRFVVFNAIW